GPPGPVLLVRPKRAEASWFVHNACKSQTSSAAPTGLFTTTFLVRPRRFSRASPAAELLAAMMRAHADQRRAEAAQGIVRRSRRAVRQRAAVVSRRALRRRRRARRAGGGRADRRDRLRHGPGDGPARVARVPDHLRR